MIDMIDWMICWSTYNWLMDWLNDWLIDWLIVWMIDWLISVHQLYEWSGSRILPTDPRALAKRVRKSSEQSNVTDSDAGDQASYEYSADSLLSDSDKESPAGGSDPPVSEKLSTVCNEIKARFLND